MTSLHRIQLSFDPQQDRLLLTLSTQDLSEYRLWMTRRMVKGFWELLSKVRPDALEDPEVRHEERTQAAEQIQREITQPAAAKYSTRVSNRPLGEDPLLLYKCAVRQTDEKTFIFHFEDSKGTAIEFIGNSLLFNALRQMIQQSVSQAEWSLQLN